MNNKNKNPVLVQFQLGYDLHDGDLRLLTFYSICTGIQIFTYKISGSSYCEPCAVMQTVPPS